MSKKIIQTNKDISISHYNGDYDDIFRFISYFYQVDIVKKIYEKNYKILEIGVGNKTVTNYLRHFKLNLTTCDINKSLKPDYVADIRQLPFPDNSFDIILACEIIEHLPWGEVKNILKELNRVSIKYVVISIPYMSISFELILKSQLFKKIFGKKIFDFFFQIPFFWCDITLSKYHHWEMGTKSYMPAKIRKELRAQFYIKEEIRPVIQNYHRFFVLEKNK